MNLFTPLSWSDAGFIFTGVFNTIIISIVAIVFGTLLGVCVGFFRAESNKYVNMILGGFLDTLRSVPLIIQLILFSTFIAQPQQLNLYNKRYLSGSTSFNPRPLKAAGGS